MTACATDEPIALNQEAIGFNAFVDNAVRAAVGTATDPSLKTLTEFKLWGAVDAANGADTTADIAGDIVVVNGKLTIKGDVNFSGSIVVKAGSTLDIKSGATIANTGSIVIEAGATLINNGTVSGTAIVNQNS